MSAFFSALGMALTTIVIFIITAFAAMKFVDAKRYWSEAGLAAIIPMLICGFIAGSIASSIALWLIVKYV